MFKRQHSGCSRVSSVTIYDIDAIDAPCGVYVDIDGVLCLLIPLLLSACEGQGGEWL